MAVITSHPSPLKLPGGRDPGAPYSALGHVVSAAIIRGAPRGPRADGSVRGADPRTHCACCGPPLLLPPHNATFTRGLNPALYTGSNRHWRVVIERSQFVYRRSSEVARSASPDP